MKPRRSRPCRQALVVQLQTRKPEISKAEVVRQAGFANGMRQRAGRGGAKWKEQWKFRGGQGVLTSMVARKVVVWIRKSCDEE